MRHADVKVTVAMIRAQREHKVLVSSEGTNVEQELYECGGGIDAYASSDDVSQVRSYPSQHSGVSGQGGWEYVERTGPRPRGAARRRAGRSAPARPRVPARPDDDRPLAGAGDHAGARVRRAPDRARPRLRNRGGVRGHELPLAGRSRQPPLRLRAHEHHGRLDDARRPRHLRVRRRGRARRARGDRGGGRAARVPQLARDRRAARRRARRLDARRRLGAHAARPDDEPPPRARRGLVRGSARGRRRRALPGDEQELVDRRQAPQLPVRDADRVGDQEGQARPDAARRDLHGRDAGLLGQARRGRRAGGMEALRAHELREGPAGPGSARLARRRARRGSATSRSGSPREPQPRSGRSSAPGDERRRRRGASCTPSAPASRGSPRRSSTSRR